jgi:capsid protein
MKRGIEIPEKLFVTHGREIEEIFRRAVHNELIKRKKLGLSISSWRDGKVIIIPPEEIPVGDEMEEAGSREGKQ